MSANQYKQHRVAIRTWNDFVRISRNRGLSNPEITEKLRSSGVEDEAIEILLDPNYSREKNRITGKQNQWKIVVGVLKMLAGLFFLLAAEIVRNGWVWGTVLIVCSLVWFGSYSRDNR